ncbi:C2 domain-containing protein 5-like isoform X2 [Artemia franciscana]|uniref:C2 domain-containing protein 5-like isoform X2 n=1 Tax=Artemia franciscana TaxID=6661 RepID=UPI0032DB8FE5
MPGKVKVKIIAGRNLPVMDRSGDTTDAFVEVKFGSTTFKTEVFRKSLNPFWNSEWFKFEADDEELQDEPLQIRIMDHDTYSAHDAIGKVFVDLNPLLVPQSSISGVMEQSSNATGNATMLSGWFPVFDTMHGVRGEISIRVKVELFSDVSRYRQSSCGVRFFNSLSIPSGYKVYTICGFVEELVVNDDPEYQWIDKIRTQRSSNEARQTLFIKLSGEVRRRIGLKALELGGNAVIGYKQTFDLEGESGVVVRGIGTVMNLNRKQHFTDSLLTSAHSDMLTNTLTDDMLRSCVLTPINVKPELSKTLKFPHLHPLKLTLEKSATFSKMQQKPIGTTFRSGVLNLMKKLKSGMAHKNGVGVEREITIPLKGVSKFSDRSLTIVEEHLSLFDSHSEFIPLNSGDEETSDDPLFFITSSESEGSSMKSPSENDPNLPLIQVEPGSAPATDELEFFHPSRIRKRACTMPSLCRCDSACGDPACSLSLTVPNMLTNRQSSEKYGSPTNLKLVKLPVVKKKSSESDLSMIPKGISGSYEAHVSHISRQISGSQYMYGLQHEMPEYPFLTLSIYPRSFVVHIGGIVSARSVKLLDRITNPDEPETRDAWWAELRMEIRSHARTLGCTFVLGYTEQTSICDEVCILSASGTAAVVDFQQLEPQEVRTRNSSGSCFGMTSSFEKDKSFKDQRVKDSSTLPEAQEYLPCSPCHVPYARTTIPCPVKLARCNVCRKYKVPDVLLATIEVPKGVSVEGKGSLIQARVCRSKREYRGGGDSQAKEVSDALPFLEYELHRQLLAKLRVRGMNAIFGLNVAVSIGDKQLIGVATGTALYLSSLPPSRPPTLSGTGSKEDQLKVAQLSKKLMEYLIESREFYGIEDSTVKNLQESGEDDSDHSDLSDDEIPDLFIPGDAKDTCVLEIDDPSELDIASILADGRPPRTFYSCTTEKLPGLNWSRLESNYLSFTRVWQGRGAYSSQKQLDGCFNTLLQVKYCV